MPKLKMLKPRLATLPDRLPMLKTLKQRQAETGRTLALNGAAWRRLRASVLAGEPLCRECTRQGRTTPATQVDHRDNDPSNNDLLNLVPLCASHHSSKTQADMGKRVPWGCDAEGWPLDPAHPWFKESPATDRHEPTCSLFFNAKSPTP